MSQKWSVYVLLSAAGGLASTWLHYRHTGDAAARFIGYPASVFLSPLVFAAVFYAIILKVSGISHAPRKKLISFLPVARVSYIPTILFLRAG